MFLCESGNISGKRRNLVIMGSLVEYVWSFWPFSMLVYNDVRISDAIVKKLPIPESTKNFVYAVKEPESNSVVYVLAVQNLSEMSALDVDCLISNVKPDAVVVQVGRVNDTDLCDFLRGSSELTKTGSGSVLLDSECAVPTSSIEVLRQCFVHKMNRDKYEEMAGNLVLREIFGVTFNEHFLVAKKAAEEVGSSFLMIEAPYVKGCTDRDDNSDAGSENANLGSRFLNVINFQLNRFDSSGFNSLVSLESRAFSSFKEAAIQSQMMKPLRLYMVDMDGVRKLNSGILKPLVDYEAPQYARGVYPLLTHLHDMFVDIPSMGTALACAQKMLSNVNTGEKVDTQLVSEVYAFKIAVEGLRIALTNAGRIDMGKSRNMGNCEFDELPVEDRSHAIFARALRTQTKNYKSIVAVVDASGLAGLRKHWNTNLPPEVEKMVEQIVTDVGCDCESPSGNRMRLLTDKPVVAVGAGASAILGASSLSKVLPASSFVKIATFHVPSSLKLILTQTQKALLFAFGKGLGPTKIVAPGLANSTLKTSAIKAAASAEKIRLVAHSMIASAEKTSLSAMRAAFYQIMRKRQLRPVGVLPWATFGCSMATCGSLLMYGDGIECAAESCPVAPSIANLGRGIENLHQVSQVVKQVESSRIQKSIEMLMYKFKNIKIQ